MAKKNTTLQIPNQKLLWSAFIIVTLLLLLPVRNKSTVKQTPTIKTEQVTKEQANIDKVDDGIYTNQKYGFKFKYPTDKFKQTFSDEQGGNWMYTIDEMNYIQLSAHPLNDNFNDQYEKLYNLSNGASMNIKHENYIKLATKDVSGRKMIITKVKTLPNAETEHVFGYEAILIMNEIDSISLVFYDFTVSQNNKALFDQIVESFVLLEE